MNYSELSPAEQERIRKERYERRESERQIAEKRNAPEAEKIAYNINAKLKESGSEYTIVAKPVTYADAVTDSYLLEYRLYFTTADGKKLAGEDYPKLQKDLDNIGLSGIDISTYRYGDDERVGNLNKQMAEAAVDYIYDRDTENGKNPFCFADSLNKKFKENNLDYKIVIFRSTARDNTMPYYHSEPHNTCGFAFRSADGKELNEEEQKKLCKVLDGWGLSVISPAASWHTDMKFGMFCSLSEYAYNKLNGKDELNKGSIWRLAEMLDKKGKASVRYYDGELDTQKYFNRSIILNDRTSPEVVAKICSEIEKGNIKLSDEGKLHITKDLIKEVCPAFEPYRGSNSKKDKLNRLYFGTGEIKLSDIDSSVEADLEKLKSCGIDVIKHDNKTVSKWNCVELIVNASKMDKVISNLQKVLNNEEPKQSLLADTKMMKLLKERKLEQLLK